MLVLVRRTVLCGLVLSLSVPAQAEVRLQQKYAEGSTIQLEAEVETEQVLTIAGMDLNSGATTTSETKIDVGQRRPDGSLELTQKVTQLHADSAYPGGVSLSFDSEDPDKQADLPQLEMILDLYRAIIDMTTTRVVDKDNKTQSVSTSLATQDLNELFQDQFDPTNLKMNAVQEESRLPSDPVDIGDVWMRTEIFLTGGSGSLTFRREYEYKGTVERDGKTLDHIVGTAKSVTLEQPANPAVPLQIANSDLTIESGTTEILFDRDSGTVVSTSDSFRVTGALDVTINGMNLEGALDLTINQTSVVKP